MGDDGLEPPPKTSGKPGVSQTGGAESGAVDAREPSADPEIAEVVAAWPTLAVAVRANILAAVRGAGGEQQEGGRQG